MCSPVILHRKANRKPLPLGCDERLWQLFHAQLWIQPETIVFGGSVVGAKASSRRSRGRSVACCKTCRMTSVERITLVASEHAKWSLRAAEMSATLVEILPLARIEHIGSTAVPRLPAKPVVDLAVGVTGDEVMRSARELARCGFDFEGERGNHAWLSCPDRSARAFVIHVLEFQGDEWIKRLRFRDILMTDKLSREKYLAAKREASRRANGWGEYTRAKSSVVSEILTHAARSNHSAEGQGSRNRSIPAATQDAEHSVTSMD